MCTKSSQKGKDYGFQMKILEDKLHESQDAAAFSFVADVYGLSEAAALSCLPLF